MKSMITPQDIKDRNFTKAVFGGYDMGAVDELIDNIAGDYEALYKENAILKGKLKVLVDKVEEYRSTDDAMRMALLAAKKMSDEMVDETKKKCEELLRNAEAEVMARKTALKSQVEGEERKLKAAQQVTANFVDMSTNLVRQQEQFLQKLSQFDSASLVRESEKTPEPVQVKEAEKEKALDKVVDDIEKSVSKAFESTSEAEPEADVSKTQKFVPPELPEGWEDDEPKTPRPKFQFRDLKFGENYDKDKEKGKK
jgi:cell division initiation protein